MKVSEGKYEPTLVYVSFIEEIARVRRYGIEKHDNSEDWRTTPIVDHFDAMLRHINAHIDGEILDPESGLMHLSHAAANIMFEIERVKGVGKPKIVKYKSSRDSLSL